ncbi:MAG: 50S ribosomal protein L32 [Bacilli bacterium]|jgi:large subunit ribosomal protein L32|nr:50S ribosomal protein L32 [Bacilli bacterium]MDD3422250.1 50S ribosomal protein L32 [Bacilli bacterium]MDD4065557.1 50S ribosomal protein L32 [Bacilli bacterium]
MAVPQRRTSKTRKAQRRANIHLATATLVACKNCGAMIKPHHVCKTCGYYDGKKVA